MVSVSEIKEIISIGKDNDYNYLIDIWDKYLYDKTGYLGDDFLNFYEKFFLASLEAKRFDISGKCCRNLKKKFPSSLRVNKLYGMYLEAVEKFDEANELYSQLISKDETESSILKRKVSILDAQNKIGEAIDCLNNYLSTFMCDCEAWLKLSQLYLQKHMYDKAGYCAEELILFQPRNHFFHEYYAEIQYTLFTVSSVQLALCHFTYAYHLNHNNLRALIGILLSSNYLINFARVKSEETKICYDWSQKQLKAKYKNIGSKALLPVKQIEKLFNNLKL